MIILFAFVAFAVTKCGPSDSEKQKNFVDSVRPIGPAPDNNSANNPSSADTNYAPGTESDTLKGKK
ncbi:MAG: hypothetical protein JST68_16790 [Bacteroidetes bacterium]|nr:hypothetical protein [Bacteroidota bacterium]